MRIRPVDMEFLYGTSFMSPSPEAYGRLILDAMRGDATLFTRDDEVSTRSARSSTRSWRRGAIGTRRWPVRVRHPGPAEADALLGEAAIGGPW